MDKTDRDLSPRATRTTTRQINRQILLNLVRYLQPISRADLARRMAMGRGMVSEITSELLASGVIVEGSVGASRRGRKPTMLYLRTGGRLVLAIDVRFPSTHLMLRDLAGDCVEVQWFNTPSSPSALVAQLTRSALNVQHAHGSRGQLEGIGIAVSGLTDRDGHILYMPQLGWVEAPVRDAIANACDVPVVVENGANACAVARLERMRRRGEHPSQFAYVDVADSVAVGLVFAGEVFHGTDNYAGGFGHISISEDGPECYCGGRGCWESFVSDAATVARYLGEEHPADVRTERIRPVTLSDVINLARSGDSRAAAALHETGKFLGTGLSLIIRAFSPGEIVIGGEITGAWDLIEPTVSGVIRSGVKLPRYARTPLLCDRTAESDRLAGVAALIARHLFIGTGDIAGTLRLQG